MIDDARNVEAGSRLECDICIVGGGAAGISIALQFLRSDLRVILLESGGPDEEPATQRLYEAEIADPDMHSPGDKYRARRFGGSTTIWGGRCQVLDEVDFEDRPWVTDHHWPFGRDEVFRWYRVANKLCEAGEVNYDARTAVPGGMRPLIKGFAPRDFNPDAIERFSCPTNFAARYQHRLSSSASVRVLLHANCTEIVTDRDGAKVEYLRVRTLEGGSFTVAAAQVILATGGLEIPRLLLASNATHAAGIGNAYDQVGRYYMCHIAGIFGRIKLNVPKANIWTGYDIAEDGTYCRRKMSLTAAAQRERQTASAFVRLHFPSIVDPSHGIAPLSALYLAKPFISYEYAKRLAEAHPGGVGRWLRHALNIAADPVNMTAFTWNWITKRTLATRKFPSVIVNSPHNLFSLDYHAEQQPNPDSRVTLGTATDALGMRRLRIDWRHSQLDIHTAQETIGALQADFARWGHGTLDYDIDMIAHDVLQYGAYGGHHIGTARMGTSPTTSVVDGNGRVHGMHNLYLTGSAVFATSSQANPTLSIVALAARLAEHVRIQAEARVTLVAAQ